MGCASSHSVDTNTKKRRIYVTSHRQPKPGLAQFPHSKPREDLLPREEETVANSNACRRRFNEHSDQLDREALSTLERSRSDRSHRGAGPSRCDSYAELATTDDDATVTASVSLVQLFTPAQGCDGLAPLPASPASGMPIEAEALPTVFDLIHSDGDHSFADDSSATSNGRLPRVSTLPALVCTTPQVPEVGCDHAHVAATTPGTTPVPGRKASPARPGLDPLRAKLMCPPGTLARF